MEHVRHLKSIMAPQVNLIASKMLLAKARGFGGQNPLIRRNLFAVIKLSIR